MFYSNSGISRFTGQEPSLSADLSLSTLQRDPGQERIKAGASRILIVEDDPLVALTIEEHLRELGYGSFEHARTEREAIEAAFREPPDLIFADVQLAAGSGLAAAHAIHSRLAIPLVFVTGHPGAVQGHDKAVVVTKPFDSSSLVEAIERAKRIWFVG